MMYYLMLQSKNIELAHRKRDCMTVFSYDADFCSSVTLHDSFTITMFAH